MKRKWKIIGRHRWVAGATISESISQDEERHSRFTATIRGYQNWKLYEGRPSEEILQLVITAVRAIRDQIDKYGEDAEAFMAVNEHSHDVTGLRNMVEIFQHPICECFTEYLEDAE